MAGNQELFRKLMNQGHSVAWEQNWSRAAEFYRQALQEIPHHPVALSNLGLALFQMGEYHQALKSYAEAAKYAPKDPIPLERIAEILEHLGSPQKAADAALRAAELYARAGDIDKAIDAWGRVTRINPEHELAHARLALVFERQGRREQAATEYIAVASLQQHAGKTEEAIKTVRHALEIAPHSLPAQQALRMLRENRRLPKPVRPRGSTSPIDMPSVTQLEAPQPTVSEEEQADPVTEAQRRALQLLASLLFEGDAEEPLSDAGARGLQAILQGSRSGEGKVDQSRILLHISRLVELQTLENYQDAAGELERALSAGLDHPAVYFDLGWLQYRAGRLESALRNLKKSLASPEFALAANFLISDIYHQQGRLRDAAVAALEALKSADAQVVPAEHAADLQQLYIPLIEAQATVDDEEAHKRLVVNVRDLLMTDGWRSQLREARLRLPTASPNAPPAPLAEILTAASSGHIVESLANVERLMHQGFWRSAMDEAFWALQHAPTYLPLHTYIGDLLSQQGYVPEAIAKFQVVARTHSARGESRRAAQLLERVIQLSPLDIAIRQQLIDLLIQMGEAETAVEHYLNMAGVYYNRAELGHARDTYMEAFRMAQQYNLDTEHAVRILYRMADIDMQSLDWRRAQRVYEQIRSLVPYDAEACLKLIDLNLRLGDEGRARSEMDNFLSSLVQSGNFQAAVAFLERLVEEQEGYLPAMRRLAELYRRVGDTEKAVEAYDVLADHLLDAGDNDGAARAIEALLKLNPPNAEEYRTFLEQLRKG